MILDTEVVKQVLTELISYVHVLLPTLLVYVVESHAHLKIWHAVRQLPHLEKEPSQNDVESSATISENQLAEICAQHGATTKIDRLKLLFKLNILVALVGIAALGHFITLEDKESVGNSDDSSTGTDEDVPGGHSHRWYYNSAFGQLNLVKLYLPIMLFLPSVFLIARFLFLFLGQKDRVVLRNTKGVPFMIFVKTDRLTLRHPALFITVASVVLAIAAFVYQNPISTMILFASIVHFLVPNTIPTKTLFEQCLFEAIILLNCSGMFLRLWIDSFSFPIRTLQFQVSFHDGETNWPEFIWSAALSSGLFGYMSLFYRMDHAFACPDERLVGSPDTEVSVKVSNSGDTVHALLRGTRITFCSRRESAPISLSDDSSTSGSMRSRFCRRDHWAKPYFHTAILSWVPVYTLMAYLKVKGYMATDAGFVGISALCFMPLVMCVAVILRAAMKGREELKKVSRYKEDWVGKDSLEVDPGVVSAHMCDDAELEGKVLISETN